MGEPIYLECDHCGGEAVTSATGLFSEDMATKCDSCGFPGSVHIDDQDEANVTAWWGCSEDAAAVCNQADCAECEAIRAVKRASELGL